jgi:putative acetyltransferase
MTEPDLIIRDERPSDVEAIYHVTRAAFADHSIGQHTEQFIVNALRAAGALSISLVAEKDGQVVGHIAFSPVAISDGSPDWYGIGPVSVLPALQGQGIGKALMREGLARLKSLSARGCILVGDPAYYQRFGFKSLARFSHEGVPQENVLALPLGDEKAQGVATFHQAFTATE